MYTNVECEDRSTCVPIVDKDVRCGVGTETKDIPDFVVEVAEVLVSLAAGQWTELTTRLLSLLHSPRFNIGILKTLLKSVSECEEFCYKVGESTILKNGFGKITLKGRESPESKSGVVFQPDFVKLLGAKVEPAKKEDGFRSRPGSGSDPDGWAGQAVTLPYFTSI